MKIDTFTYDPSQPNSPQLKLAGKRYTNDGFRLPCTSSSGFSLLLAHGSALHKEQWEPTIEALLSNDSRGLIREVWAVDWQSHGQAAILNEDALKARPDGISISEWGFGLSRFMKSSHTKGRRLIAVGHSAGTSAIMFSTKYLSEEANRYAAIILVEPPMIDRDVYNANLEDREGQIRMIMKAVAASRSSWSTKEEALTWLSGKYPWKAWDPRVLRLFVEYGLRETTDENGCSRITVNCAKQHEARAYNDLDATFQATDMLAPVSQSTPMHIIFGARKDIVPKYGQDSLIDMSKGRCMQSVTRLPNVGHLIVQEKPEPLAAAIYTIIETLAASSSARL